MKSALDKTIQNRAQAIEAYAARNSSYKSPLTSAAGLLGLRAHNTQLRRASDQFDGSSLQPCSPILLLKGDPLGEGCLNLGGRWLGGSIYFLSPRDSDWMMNSYPERLVNATSWEWKSV